MKQRNEVASSASRQRITVLGDGAWGTTLAILLTGKKHHVTLWGAFPAYLQLLREKRENVKFLPGITIPSSITLEEDIQAAVVGADMIVTAVPSHHMRETCRRVAPAVSGKKVSVINGSKGIETETLMRMSEVIAQELPGAHLAVISGPSHAEEVAREKPTTVVVASSRRELALEAQHLFMTDHFRVYTNPDLIGVEIAGAIKNTIAIAAGATDGLGLGDNAKAALITRGIVEISRLGIKMGALPSTFAGLAGLGDLITTCVSHHGRNRSVGEMIAQGKSCREILEEMEMVAEGVRTAKAAYQLSRRHGIEMPITRQVYAVLYEEKDPLEAVSELMHRRAKPEFKML